MKYLKLFESLENIHEICKEYKIKNYTINSDGSIDVDGSVNLHGRYLTKLPLKFRNVSSSFYCDYNNLTSLEGGPSNIGGNFHCSSNKLTSLEGSPSHVGGYFNCSYNKMTKLEGGPTHVGEFFACDNNNLTSLEGGPTYVGSYFSCNNNNLESLEGFPIYFDPHFYCTNNPIYEIWQLFEDASKIELFNDYDIIRGKDIVIDRLNDFLITIGKNPVKSVKGYNNILFENFKFIIESNNNLLFRHKQELLLDDIIVSESYLCIEEKDEFFDQKYVTIHDLKTHEEFRGKGYATILLEKIFEYVKNDLKLNIITLIVYKKNHKAVNLYFKCGFEIFKEYEGSYSLIKRL